MNAFLLFQGDVAAEATVANSKQFFSGVIHLLLLPGLLLMLWGGVFLLTLPILTTKNNIHHIAMKFHILFSFRHWTRGVVGGQCSVFPGGRQGQPDLLLSTSHHDDLIIQPCQDLGPGGSERRAVGAQVILVEMVVTITKPSSLGRFSQLIRETWEWDFNVPNQVVVRALVTQSQGDVAELWIQEVLKGEEILFSYSCPPPHFQY